MAKGFHGFCSPMVSPENQDLCGGETQDYCINTRIAERLIAVKKPFGAMHGLREEVERLSSMLSEHSHLVVRPIEETHQMYHGMYHMVIACQRGTLGELFDLEALAGAYRVCGLSGIADHILGRSNFAERTLEGYFEDWDFQDAELAKPQRLPTVHAWETGLILGYPVRETIERCYGINVGGES